MSDLPVMPLSPEEQQRFLGQMHLLMAKQVKSYHKHRRMGESSSVPSELARELMESVGYTLNLAGGAFAGQSVEETLRLGQARLEEKRRKAVSMLELVSATAPQWQTECRWEALRCLRHYLDTYDPLHLAHKGPEDLFYPVLIAPQEAVQGIESCLFYLNILWIENQIMAGVPDDVLDRFWDSLPAATLNQCEPLLINGIGKALLGSGLDPLIFAPEEQPQLVFAMLGATGETLRDAAKLLCHWLDLKDENARMYVQAVIPQLAMWIGDNARSGNMGNIFVKYGKYICLSKPTVGKAAPPDREERPCALFDHIIPFIADLEIFHRSLVQPQNAFPRSPAQQIAPMAIVMGRICQIFAKMHQKYCVCKYSVLK